MPRARCRYCRGISGFSGAKRLELSVPAVPGLRRGFFVQEIAIKIRGVREGAGDELKRRGLNSMGAGRGVRGRGVRGRGVPILRLHSMRRGKVGGEVAGARGKRRPPPAPPIKGGGLTSGRGEKG